MDTNNNQQQRKSRKAFLTQGAAATGLVAATTTTTLFTGCNTNDSSSNGGVIIAPPHPIAMRGRTIYHDGSESGFWVCDNEREIQALINQPIPSGGSTATSSPAPTPPPLKIIADVRSYANMTVPIYVGSAGLQGATLDAWGVGAGNMQYVRGPLYGFINKTGVCVAGIVLSVDTVASRIGNAFKAVPGMVTRYGNLFKPFGVVGGAGAWTMYAAGEIGAGEFLMAVLAIVAVSDLALILAAAGVTLAILYLAYACYKGVG